MIIRYLIPFLSFGAILVSGLYIVNPGPKYPPTKGEVWPKPQQENKEDAYYTFDPSNFKIKITNKECEILSNAIERYSYIVTHKNGVHSRNRRIRSRKNHRIVVNGTVQQDDRYKGVLAELQVELKAPCEEYPSFGMDEQYHLKVSKKSRLESDSIWGIIRGLETFAQLFYLSEDYNEIRVNKTQITDFPTYPHRGLLLDTSRHYITVGNILKTLDAMSMNKMNVFHWHIVDDQSFPYQSEKFPELSDKGAFHSSMVYTKEDIERIVQYARIRGIRVVPEFDVPGHTRSWGVAYPSILTQCYMGENVVGLGPINPLSDVALKLLKDLFEEVHEWFPDKFLHVGGDEVDLDCWNSNPELIKYMRDNNVTAEGLHALFMGNVIPLLNKNINPIVWQEVFDENVTLSKDTIIQVWKYEPTKKMTEVLSAGHRVLFSSNWYLDYLSNEWSTFYKYDPRQMVYDYMKNETILSNIVGGEACMWGEMVDDRNVISRVWPRASAIAETLWNSVLDRDRRVIAAPAEAYNRLEEHACRMLRRGVDADPPSGPGFCVV
ncbi:beta-hexosaminidase subunit beta-like [Epargyreus clarus]|uniref:beta-hexosaminidase subunit beta-like n=1 Tax=Epargyreus clarus TaxID=520877 RepID=UPI003C2C4B20